MPLKGQPPVEPADHRLICLHVKLKGVPVDGVDHRTHDGAGVLTNPKDEASQNIVQAQFASIYDQKKFIKLLFYLFTFPVVARSSLGHTHNDSQERSGHHQWHRWHQ